MLSKSVLSWILRLAITLLIGIKPIGACNNGDVRLVGGSSPYDGDVELCANGVWKRVCADLWDWFIEGKVVCRELGCADSDSTYRYTLNGTGGENVVYIEECNGVEDELRLCTGLNLNYNCTGSPYNGVGVACVFRVRPPTPVNISVSDIRSTSLTISYGAASAECISGSISYDVYCETMHLHRDWNTTTTQMSVTATGLASNMLYNCCVIAGTSEGSADSKCIQVQTSLAPPGPPLNVRAINIRSSSLSLMWQQPLSDSTRLSVSSYSVTCNISANIRHTPSTSVTIPNLHPYTEYKCCVSANGATTGEKGNTSCIMATTLETVPSGVPKNLTCQPLNSSTVKLSWSPPLSHQHNGVIRGYNITITNDDSIESDRTISTDSTSITVPNLHPHYNYTCSVAAYTVGVGPYQNRTVTMPEDAPSSPPQNLTSEVLNLTSVRLSWSPPPLSDQNGVIRGYNVTLSNKKWTQSYTTNTTSLILTHLTPGSTYNWSVATYTIKLGPDSNDTTLVIPRSNSTLTDSALPLLAGLGSSLGALATLAVCVTCIVIVCVVTNRHKKQKQERDDDPNATQAELEMSSVKTDEDDHTAEGEEADYRYSMANSIMKREHITEQEEPHYQQQEVFKERQGRSHQNPQTEHHYQPLSFRTEDNKPTESHYQPLRKNPASQAMKERANAQPQESHYQNLPVSRQTRDTDNHYKQVGAKTAGTRRATSTKLRAAYENVVFKNKAERETGKKRPPKVQRRRLDDIKERIKQSKITGQTGLESKNQQMANFM